MRTIDMQYSETEEKLAKDVIEFVLYKGYHVAPQFGYYGNRDNINEIFQEFCDERSVGSYKVSPYDTHRTNFIDEYTN